MSTFANKTVAIVGASSGIGLATASLVAEQGARVAMLSRSRRKLDEAASLVSGSPLVFAVDMLDRAAVSRAFETIGKVDHLVLTAVADELFSKAPIGDLTSEQVERTFDKLRGFVNVTGVVAKAMPKDGSITLLTGASALKPPRDGFSVLAAASASIVSFGKALALELAPIRVNVLMAGVVDTPIHADHRESMKSWAESDLLVKRFGQPEDIAHGIQFLIENRYVTAQTFVVDGGFVAL